MQRLLHCAQGRGSPCPETLCFCLRWSRSRGGGGAGEAWPVSPAGPPRTPTAGSPSSPAQPELLRGSACAPGLGPAGCPGSTTWGHGVLACPGYLLGPTGRRTAQPQDHRGLSQGSCLERVHTFQNEPQQSPRELARPSSEGAERSELNAAVKRVCEHSRAVSALLSAQRSLATPWRGSWSCPANRCFAPKMGAGGRGGVSPTQMQGPRQRAVRRSFCWVRFLGTCGLSAPMTRGPSPCGVEKLAWRAPAGGRLQAWTCSQGRLWSGPCRVQPGTARGFI